MDYVGDLSNLMKLVREKIETDDDGELEKIKVHILTKMRADEADLFFQLGKLEMKILDKGQLSFLEEVLVCLIPEIWSSRTIEQAARIFGHDQAMCPILLGQLMLPLFPGRRSRTLFELVIPRCLGCIKCFDVDVLDDILGKESSIEALCRACRYMGSYWDADANGCFASCLPKWFLKHRCQN